jgi:hypothetical protein
MDIRQLGTSRCALMVGMDWVWRRGRASCQLGCCGLPTHHLSGEPHAPVPALATTTQPRVARAGVRSARVDDSCALEVAAVDCIVVLVCGASRPVNVHAGQRRGDCRVNYRPVA